MRKIIALWAVPRSTSTAFEHMMRQRKDFVCLHEPFGEAWYQGENPLWPRFKPGEKTTPGLTIESVWKDIQEKAKENQIFFKDFPHYLNHVWTPSFLENFINIFLIRNPSKTITSIFDKWPDFDELEVGFPEQRALFDLLNALTDKVPIVIDSDDLLEKPEKMVEKFCVATGIPYIKEALQWDSNADTSIYSWWDGGSFHKNLSQSSSLKYQKRNYLDIDQTPYRVKQVYRRMLPHYEHLYKHRVII